MKVFYDSYNFSFLHVQINIRFAKKKNHNKICCIFRTRSHLLSSLPKDEITKWARLIEQSRTVSQWDPELFRQPLVSIVKVYRREKEKCLEKVRNSYFFVLVDTMIVSKFFLNYYENSLLFLKNFSKII